LTCGFIVCYIVLKKCISHEEGFVVKKAVQLGCGLVGNVIAADMMEDFDVTVVDLNATALEALKKKFP